MLVLAVECAQLPFSKLVSIYMDKLLFSIIADGGSDILERQISSINRFSPGSFICIHNAKDTAFSGREVLDRIAASNVFLNPDSYVIRPQEGVLHAHISNFQHAIAQSLDFDKIVLFSQQELLTKSGLGEHTKRFTIGAQTELYENIDTANNWAGFRPEVLNFPGIKRALSLLGLPLFAAGQAEGQFFSRDVFAHLERVFVDSFPMEPCGFPTEQIVPSTLAMRYGFAGTNISLPITFSAGNSQLEISEDVIRQLKKGDGALHARARPGALRPAHVGACVLKDVYAVSLPADRYETWSKVMAQLENT
ncbi:MULTISPECIES: hypothetical protein [unclassified Rhizobium]|uniref:hypothetical protein n=1 Tax=unclassified Rhizobium TaxID=2613769 RepID=UPI001ADC0CB8|nr:MULTISPECIES: hypothetical protein [unclassified Rhizobium]MBO9127398.1 hypothetical protein [Rhizobium sp. 16-488-2b]MBO9177841.1 hypothetical protein [Rhizobium sp. 16-488-2a]